jgi:hypothetical protein
MTHVPDLRSIGLAARNHAFALRLDDAPVLASTVLYLSTSNSTWLGIPLPVSLDPLGFQGCFLHVGLSQFLTGSTDAQGTQLWDFGILPDNLLLTVAPIYFQAIGFDLSALTFFASNGYGVLLR